MALYAYTFASYAISGSAYADNDLLRKAIAGGVILVFTLINVWSVSGMGKIEDLLVYTKVVILIIISFVLINNSQTTLPTLLSEGPDFNVFSILIVASITFVSYEGFQLVINATNEMEKPEINIPRAIYSALVIVILLYVFIAVGGILTIPFEDIVRDKEYALASGADKVLGHRGTDLVILGALLATSSAISGTLFGASRQMSAIAQDGYFPKKLAKRINNIPVYAIISMALLAFIFVLSGSLQVILEFGSFTFLLVSLLMAYANFKIRKSTKSSTIVTMVSVTVLAAGTVLILYHEFVRQPKQLIFIAIIYSLLTLSAWIYSRVKL